MAVLCAAGDLPSDMVFALNEREQAASTHFCGCQETDDNEFTDGSCHCAGYDIVTSAFALGAEYLPRQPEFELDSSD